MPIQRTAINPWPWSVDMGFNQGEVVEGFRRTLYCAGQTAMSAEGQPQHAGDMPAQVAMAVDNLEAVLREAGMGLANVVRLNIYTTDVDEFFASYGTMVERLAAAGVAPPGTLLGVARLAFPELMIEIEATAVD
jgi:enamine deaminase RidA (YjgF/YER057c/UK114 family)